MRDDKNQDKLPSERLKELKERLNSCEALVKLNRELAREKPEYKYELSRVLVNNAIALALNSDPVLALEYFDEAIRIQRSLIENGRTDLKIDLAKALYNKAYTLKELGQLEAVLECSNEEIELYRNLINYGQIDLKRELAVSLVNYKGHVLFQWGMLKAALECYEEAVSLYQILTRNSPELKNDLATALGNAGKTLDLLGDHNAALEYLKKATRLYRELISDQPDLKYGLASQLVGEANVMGSLGDLKGALECYDEAIYLYQELIKRQPDFKIRLASALISKTEVLRRQGMLEAALKCCDEAISILRDSGEEIPKKIKLAKALGNKGVVLRDQGALGAALKYHEKEIALIRNYTEVQPKLKKDLVVALRNLGVLLSRKGELFAALEHYEEAIKLNRDLIEDHPDLTSQLAIILVNKGSLLLYNQGIKIAALECYNEAISLVLNGEFSLIRSEILSNAYLGIAESYLQLAKHINACDMADEGLNILIDLEKRGIYALRRERESLFEITLRSYLAAQQPQFLPEIIQENLDPDQSGSAPTSEAMHMMASTALQQGIYMLLQSPQTEAIKSHLSELTKLTQTLTRWRIRYFSGEATSAWLRAMDYEKQGNAEKAEKIIKEYIEMRPLDPEGPKILGDYYIERKNSTAAIEAYREAIRVLARDTPEKDDLDARVMDIIKIAKCLRDLHLLEISIELQQIDLPSIAAINEHYDKLHVLLQVDLLEDLQKNTYSKNVSDQWRPRLQLEMEGLWRAAADQRNHWFESYSQGVAEKERNQAFEGILAMTRGLFRSLGHSWEGYQQGIVQALREIWCYTSQQQNQDSEWLEQETARMVTMVMEHTNQSLANSELEYYYQKLQSQLKQIWQILQEPERRFLACGMRFMKQRNDEAMRRSAGLHFGLAVEWSLANRIFQPWKARWLKEKLPLSWKHPLAKSIEKYLTKSDQYLMLGSMVAVFNSVLTHAGDPNPPDLPREIANFLREQLPNFEVVLDADKETREARKNLLEKIKSYRNECAHPKSLPTAEALDFLWTVVVEGDNAFFRYLGASHLQPETEGSDSCVRK